MQDHQDYSPILETTDDGVLTDMLIEDMLSLIYSEVSDAERFDQTYTGIVRTYVNPECPNLCAGHALRDRVNAGAVHYLAMLQLDYEVVSKGSANWPIGGFPFMPDACVAVSVRYPDGIQTSNWAPGRSINQASLAAIMQIAREVSTIHHNQLQLAIPPRYDA